MPAEGIGGPPPMLALCIASICSSVICDLCCCCCCARSRSAIICCMAICCWYFLRSSSNACCCAWKGDCGAPGGAAAAPMRSWGRSRPPGDVWMWRVDVAIGDLHRRREEPAELLILGAGDVDLLHILG